MYSSESYSHLSHCGQGISILILVLCLNIFELMNMIRATADILIIFLMALTIVTPFFQNGHQVELYDLQFD